MRFSLVFSFSFPRVLGCSDANLSPHRAPSSRNRKDSEGCAVIGASGAQNRCRMNGAQAGPNSEPACFRFPLGKRPDVLPKAVQMRSNALLDKLFCHIRGDPISTVSSCVLVTRTSYESLD